MLSAGISLNTGKWQGFGDIDMIVLDSGSEGTTSRLTPFVREHSLTSPPHGVCSLMTIRHQLLQPHRGCGRPRAGPAERCLLHPSGYVTALCITVGGGSSPFSSSPDQMHPQAQILPLKSTNQKCCSRCERSVLWGRVLWLPPSSFLVASWIPSNQLENTK